MDHAKKVAATAGLALYGLVQLGYWLLTGRCHPGFDGLWRHRFEFGRIWGLRPAAACDRGADE